MSRFIKIGKAAQYLGVSIQTLRRWEEKGLLMPDHYGAGETRYYEESKILNTKKASQTDLTIAYARDLAMTKRKI